jgi:hypothetical protein
MAPKIAIFSKTALNYSPPASVEVKKMWFYTSTPPYAFME